MSEKPILRFHDWRRNKPFLSNNYVLMKRKNGYFAIAVAPSEKKTWRRITKEMYKDLGMMKGGKMDPQKVIDNILGVKKPKVVVPTMKVNRNLTTKQYKKKYGPKGDVDGDGVLNWKDCRPLDRTRDMVHYGYYEATKENGKVETIYAGSKAGVRKIGELRTPPVKYIKIEEMTYAQALAKRGEAGLAESRANTAGFTSSGQRTGRPAGEPKAPY